MPHFEIDALVRFIDFRDEPKGNRIECAGADLQTQRREIPGGLFGSVESPAGDLQSLFAPKCCEQLAVRIAFSGESKRVAAGIGPRPKRPRETGEKLSDLLFDDRMQIRGALRVEFVREECDLRGEPLPKVPHAPLESPSLGIGVSLEE